eukprot:UN02244
MNDEEIEQKDELRRRKFRGKLVNWSVEKYVEDARKKFLKEILKSLKNRTAEFVKEVEGFAIVHKRLNES